MSIHCVSFGMVPLERMVVPHAQSHFAAVRCSGMNTVFGAALAHCVYGGA
jgi:hypothetical protein